MTADKTENNRDLVITRVIDAPRERVFKTWTTQLPEWWGPHGMTTPFYEMDLRPGGVFRTIMRAPDGTEYPTRGVFLEVVIPDRIVFTDAFDSDWQPHPDAFLRPSRLSKTWVARRSIRLGRSIGPWRVAKSTSAWGFTRAGAKAWSVSLPSRRPG